MILPSASLQRRLENSHRAPLSVVLFTDTQINELLSFSSLMKRLYLPHNCFKLFHRKRTEDIVFPESVRFCLNCVFVTE